ncbi:hypothetical protein RKLH11_2499 [Rhodobacteraceae bacterium KLH11]|nr:hypothetical protein RKLH11_2499 [Rhodobacteraceae bacterium KLH11]
MAGNFWATLQPPGHSGQSESSKGVGVAEKFTAATQRPGLSKSLPLCNPDTTISRATA